MQSEATQNAIVMLDGRIAETQATLGYFIQTARRFEGRLLSLQRQRNSFTNQLAPISSLPNELLSAIFEYGHLSSPLWTRPPIEIVLSHINQRFRDVALNTQSLWTRIEVFFCTPFNKVVAYLHRSGTSPLDLHLDIHMDIDSSSNSQLEPDSHIYTIAEWETIMSHMSRCRHISVRCNKTYVVDDIIVSLRTVYAPVLQSLKIECPNNGRVEAHQGPYGKIFDGGAPALTVVRLDEWALQRCLPPLSGVTSLTLVQATWGIAWPDLRDVLHGCLALTCLVIRDIFLVNVPNSSESSIILPSLKFLHLFPDAYGETHIERILVAISAPVLETLTINDISEDVLVDFSQLQNSDHFPCLRYFSVSLYEGEAISRESWILFCSVFPRIVHFELRSEVYETSGAETLILALAYSPAEGASSTAPLILPELHMLSFSHIDVPTSVLLCDLVSKRHTAGWPLRLLQLPAVILHHHDGALARSLSRLQALIEVNEYQLDENLVESALNLE